MFSFINFATVIVFLVTMFDDSTQLVTVPRSLPDPIAELCRALVVLKRERFHIRKVFKLSSDGHTEKVYWYGRSQYIEALNAPHHTSMRMSVAIRTTRPACAREHLVSLTTTHTAFLTSSLLAMMKKMM